MTCSDAAGWLNVAGQTCIEYEQRRWCERGHVLNASAAGPIFGSPEASCCVCGRAENERRSVGDKHHSMVFFATHNVDDRATSSLLAHVERDLHRLPPNEYGHMRPWVLLYAPRPPTDGASFARWRHPNAEVFPWTLAQMFTVFPAMKQSYSSWLHLDSTRAPTPKYEQSFITTLLKMPNDQFTTLQNVCVDLEPLTNVLKSTPFSTSRAHVRYRKVKRCGFT